MSRLIAFGPGEIVDRLTILDLKLAHGGGDHFAHERSDLLIQLALTHVPPAGWFKEALQLALINGLLWRAEDDLRAYRRGPTGSITGPPEVAQLAFRIQDLNDQRAALIATINHLTGHPTAPEKI